LLILLSIYFSLLIYSVKLSIIIITTYFYYCHLLSFLRVNDESSVSRKRLEVTVKFEWEYFTHKCTPIPMLNVTTQQATSNWQKCTYIWTEIVEQVFVCLLRGKLILERNAHKYGVGPHRQNCIVSESSEINKILFLFLSTSFQKTHFNDNHLPTYLHEANLNEVVWL